MRTWGLALLCAAIVGSHGPVYWDSYGYVTQAMTGDIGGLGVGRPVFALISRVVAWCWLEAGGSVWQLEPVLRWWWAAVTALSAPLTAWVAGRLGTNARVGTLSALVVATSPALAHGGFAVLTDGPTVPLMLLAVGCASSRRHSWALHAVSAGLATGLAIGMREAALFMTPVVGLLLWRVQPRRLGAVMLAAACTAVTVALPMIWVWATQPGYTDTITGWLSGMAHDRALQHWGLRELGTIVGWVVTLSPFALGGTMLAWRQRSAMPILLPLTAGASTLVLFVMTTYHGLTYSPRYLLLAFPLAVALPAAWWADRCSAGASPRRLPQIFAGVIALQVVVAAVVVRQQQSSALAVSTGLPAILAQLPADAVIVTGHACPAVTMIRTQARFDHTWSGPIPDWQTICPGWSWPTDPASAFDHVRASGRLLVLDVRSDAWRGAEQRRSLAQVQAYADGGAPGVRLLR